MSLVQPWIRPRHPGGCGTRHAHLAFIAILDGARIDDAQESARARWPNDEVWDSLDVEVHARATDLGRLDAALAGRAALSLEARDPHERWQVERCQRYCTIEAVTPDAPAMQTLQAALLLLCALAEEGDLLLGLDRTTARWWAPAELATLRPERPFDLDEHVRVVVEAVERAPGVGHLVRSRGLEKFARPNIGCRTPRASAESLAEILRDVARMLAEGEALDPGDRLTIPDLPPLTWVPRSEDCLDDVPPEQALLYELRDLSADGGAEPACARLIAALRPKPRLRVLK